MGQRNRYTSRTKTPHPPCRDTAKDVHRRDFKLMVDALFRRFMQEFSHAVPDTPAGKATMLEVFARRLLDHAKEAPTTPARTVP